MIEGVLVEPVYSDRWSAEGIQQHVQAEAGRRSRTFHNWAVLAIRNWESPSLVLRSCLKSRGLHTMERLGCATQRAKPRVDRQYPQVRRVCGCDWVDFMHR